MTPLSAHTINTMKKEKTIMKQAYPITILRTSDFFVVYIPDFDINTQGETVAEAMEMARDAIGMCGCYKQDKGEKIPAPSDVSSIKQSLNEIVTLVDVDFDEYRRKHEMRTVRKNVSLPSWLNEEAERANVNFSAVLQNALKTELHISDR